MALACVGTTFPVDDVLAGPPRSIGIAAHKALESLLGRTGPAIEACHPSEGRLIPCGFHGFAAAVHFASSVHVPLAIAPDHVWLVIAQGLAAHARLDPERCRGRLVRPESRWTLEIPDDPLTRHAPPEEWAKVWDPFTALLERECPDLVGLLTAGFSTTSRSERLACAVAAMDVFESCFEYRVCSICGIPEITLEGTTDDWRAVRERAEHLSAFGMRWWLDALLPVLDQFVAASGGNVDRSWWRGFYKGAEGRRGPYITGHIRAFFPYVCLRERKLVRRIVRQPLSASGRNRQCFLTSDNLPGGLSQARFMWRYRGEDRPMDVVAGFVGVREGTGGRTIRPEVGWVVRDSPVPAVQATRARAGTSPTMA